MERFDYMSDTRKMIPEDLIKNLNLEDKFHNNMILVEIQKGMYVPPPKLDK